jgi:hypothetical protein
MFKHDLHTFFPMKVSKMRKYLGIQTKQLEESSQFSQEESCRSDVHFWHLTVGEVGVIPKP